MSGIVGRFGVSARVSGFFGFLAEFRCRSVAAAGDLLFFASPKESRQRKGEPKSRPLRFASGFLALLVWGGNFRN